MNIINELAFLGFELTFIGSYSATCFSFCATQKQSEVYIIYVKNFQYLQFISDKRKRSLLKKDDDLRRRIELIQDFEMPTVSSNVKMSPDQQYIFATGWYDLSEHF